MNDQAKPPHNNSQKLNEGSIGKGIGIGLLIYIVAFLLNTIIGLTTIKLLVGPILHLIAITWFFAKREKFTGIGLLILAGVAILLASACFGIVIYQLNKG